MRTVQLEYLRPHEILEEQQRKSIVYLPVAPLEWHGPAMPIGTDPLVAQSLARAMALQIGGVVAPTLFMGTERERPAYILRNKGFEDPEDMYVIGMDVPKNTMPSYYAREDLFAVTVREHLRLLVLHGYKLIVLVNGHGAWGQVETLKRLAVEFSNETPSQVLYCMPDITLEDGSTPDFGHATLTETALVRYITDESVDLSQYPPRDIPLNYTDWGIADDAVFHEEDPGNRQVIWDPRDATVEYGEKLFKAALASMCKTVEEAYNKNRFPSP